MKPFVLTAAVNMGMNPIQHLLRVAQPDHHPHGTPEPSHGRSTPTTTAPPAASACSSATLRSDNSVYAQLCMDVGSREGRGDGAADGHHEPAPPVPSITLGTEVVNPLELATAYATLASGGIYHPPQAIVKVVLPSGKVDWRPKIKGRRVLSAGVASTVNKVLQANASSGTGAGTAAYVSVPRAGKTGTTDDLIDAWYCGYTPNLVTTVWMGYPDDYLHPMPGVQGATYCVPMWGKFNKVALADFPATPFPSVSMIYKPWKGKYSTMSPSPSASGSASPSPKTTITISPTPQADQDQDHQAVADADQEPETHPDAGRGPRRRGSRPATRAPAPEAAACSAGWAACSRSSSRPLERLFRQPAALARRQRRRPRRLSWRATSSCTGRCPCGTP